MTEPVGIKMIIRKHCKQLYANKFDGLDEMDPFLEIHKLPMFIQWETDNLKSLLSMKKIEFISRNIPMKKIPDSST